MTINQTSITFSFIKLELTILKMENHTEIRLKSFNMRSIYMSLQGLRLLKGKISRFKQMKKNLISLYNLKRNRKALNKFTIMTKNFKSKKKKKSITMKERKSGSFMNKLEFNKLRFWKNSLNRINLRKKRLMKVF